ncbi:MAG: hypothetical protein PHC92_10370 [Syntrophomonadaceae bacterium]|nr:hypothetical protein [Syntrophomonadaceae bacterium]MDD3024117.1 hypothetical protein [Syntrophomonadaceae bacterium]
MKKMGFAMMLLGLTLLSFGCGYFLASNQNIEMRHQAAIGIEERPNIKAAVFNENSKVVCEKEYQRCKHLIISEFERKDELLGKNIEEIRAIFREENGFRVSWQGDTLLIRQIIDDWCPDDKSKCRLKEYQGRVAVYQGPNAQNDILLRVTSIIMSSLPAEVQKSIRDNKFEFANEQLLNDALENLDEY